MDFSYSKNIHSEGNPTFAGLYIHVPFCRSKCRYCNFYSLAAAENHIPRYVQALIKEMVLYAGSSGPFDTIYLGGGTPSMLSPEQLCEIFKEIRTHFSIAPANECTIEVNPGDLTDDFIAFLTGSPVNRINMGIQAFDDRILTFLGRRHRAEDALVAFERLRRSGFDNVGIDLMYGIPGQDRAAWRGTLHHALSLSPEHLSCYQLTLEPTTPLGKEFAAGRIELPDEGAQYDFFMTTTEVLEQGGYIQYEVSNFARGDAYRSRHNSKYWDHTPYLGLGPSAHSFTAGRRWWNHPSLEHYLTDLGNGIPPVDGSENLSAEQLVLEALFLGMRTRRGVNLDILAKSYSYDLMVHKADVIDDLTDRGLTIIEDGWLRPTSRGMAMADHLSAIL